MPSASAAAPAELPRKQIDRFEINRLIDSGSVGSVYEAYDPVHDRQVALKVCRDAVAEENFAVRQLANETAIASKLNHPNIVRLLETGVEGGRPYLVMEYVPNGRTLKRHCHDIRERLPVPLVVEIGVKCADALHYAHQHGVTHRDVKPANILLRKDFVPKLTDFSIAMLEDVDGAVTMLSRAGSPLYMAPEQISADESNPSTDIYSLGVVLYELLAQRPPFNARTMRELADMIIRRPLPPLAALRPDLPRGLESVIRRALEKHCTKRYTRAADMGADLEIVMDNL